MNRNSTRPVELWPHQVEAVEAVCRGFATGRCTVVAACGTGKTNVGIEVASRVAPRGRVLVVVPTLELLRQTGEAYRAAGFRVHAACSRLGDPVSWPDDARSTDPVAIAAWTRQDTGIVVVATYQALPTIIAAHQSGTPSWDLVTIDEAHRSAGGQGRRWSAVHDDTRVLARRRLYMTATPRVFTDDEDATGMDDETVFGPVAYRLTFARAIELGLLAPYQVMIPVITNSELQKFLDATPLARIGNTDLPREMVTAQIALARAINHHGLSKAITFHNRVDAAKRFAATWQHVATATGGRAAGAVVKAVSGSTPIGIRQQRLSALACTNADRPYIISNAKVLSEGVDVPELDAVVFADPRDSATDVMQAVGRALRKGSCSDKTATIIIPLLINDLENPESAIEGSNFATAWRAIRALSSHDECLAHWIDEQHPATLGTYNGANPQSLPPWLTVTGTDVPPGLVEAIRLRSIRSTTTAWDYGYRHLKAFVEAHGHANVPVDFCDPDDGFPTGSWAAYQRRTHNAGKLAEARRHLLEDLGICWDTREAKWMDGYQHLQAFVQAHGHANVPAGYRDPNDDYATGHWVMVQRTAHKNETLTAARRRLLEDLGICWDINEAKWMDGYQHLQAFVRAHGHANVPVRFCDPDDGFPTGNWVAKQRTERKAGKLSEARKHLLEDLGICWDIIEAKWMDGYQHLKAFREATGHTNVPSGYRDPNDGYTTGTWVSFQRTRQILLTEERRRMLDDLGFIWKRKDAQWMDGYQHLKAFREATGHTNVPRNYRDPADHYPTGEWAYQQRDRGRLPEQRRRLLDDLDLASVHIP